MSVTNILNQVPENVIKAAKLALNKEVSSANNVGDGVMFGGRNSYEDDDWVKITYNSDGEISKIVRPHPFSDKSEEDITSEIMNKFEQEEEKEREEDTEAKIKRKFLIRE